MINLAKTINTKKDDDATMYVHIYCIVYIDISFVLVLILLSGSFLLQDTGLKMVCLTAELLH